MWGVVHPAVALSLPFLQITQSNTETIPGQLEAWLTTRKKTQTWIIEASGLQERGDTFEFSQRHNGCSHQLYVHYLIFTAVNFFFYCFVMCALSDVYKTCSETQILFIHLLHKTFKSLCCVSLNAKSMSGRWGQGKGGISYKEPAVSIWDILIKLYRAHKTYFGGRLLKTIQTQPII